MDYRVSSQRKGLRVYTGYNPKLARIGKKLGMTLPRPKSGVVCRGYTGVTFGPEGSAIPWVVSSLRCTMVTWLPTEFGTEGNLEGHMVTTVWCTPGLLPKFCARCYLRALPDGRDATSVTIEGRTPGYPQVVTYGFFIGCPSGWLLWSHTEGVTLG